MGRTDQSPGWSSRTGSFQVTLGHWRQREGGSPADSGFLLRGVPEAPTHARAAENGLEVDEADPNMDNGENWIKTRMGHLFNLLWLMIPLR